MVHVLKHAYVEATVDDFLKMGASEVLGELRIKQIAADRRPANA